MPNCQLCRLLATTNLARLSERVRAYRAPSSPLVVSQKHAWRINLAHTSTASAQVPPAGAADPAPAPPPPSRASLQAPEETLLAAARACWTAAATAEVPVAIAPGAASSSAATARAAMAARLVALAAAPVAAALSAACVRGWVRARAVGLESNSVTRAREQERCERRAVAMRSTSEGESSRMAAMGGQRSCCISSGDSRKETVTCGSRGRIGRGCIGGEGHSPPNRRIATATRGRLKKRTPDD